MADDALSRAIAALDNNQSAFARICGVSQPTVWAWLRNGKKLPAEYVLKVEAATGVSRHELRPDIYPVEPAQPVSSVQQSASPDECPENIGAPA